jgi:hypothetical protein
MIRDKTKKSNDDMLKRTEPSVASKKAAAEIFGAEKQSSLIIKPGFEKLKRKKNKQ